ncbi:hypothetical protein ACO1Y9_24450 [Klebsiella quasipneumoniae]|jgi:hypothetical protein|uniref:hypothetical protein n=1 Tax=Enterobacteriaceae TaxID=543 RepID=UPI0011E615A0|nr:MULTISPECIES: hypothetical protein [Enterobacter cloacae complex]QMR63733.1 hypothetical protein HV226_25200 [Escherichia coli]MCS0627700.1 hypothetical protein [Enterobacter asburiae]HAY5199153.1 hypothetical protein [Escherichia coli]HDR2366032.1 hypothetical protein [Enterobacter asburiae]HDT2137211.1 hypothetical protein [Enterobacter roggenkampii]
MAVCPFCKSQVHEDADVCSSCNAEKVTTFFGHLEHAIQATKPMLGMFAMVGLLLGVFVGFNVGMNSIQLFGWISGVLTCVIVTIFPALLRTAVICRNGKVKWYR